MAHNAENWIQANLESVRNQRYEEYEQIVINGSSTDSTIDYIQQYKDQISYFVSEPDEGIYHAMNKGISASKGDVLFFLNSDDAFSDACVLSDVAKEFMNNPGTDLIFGNIYWKAPHRTFKVIQPPIVTRKYLAKQTIFHQSLFSRRDVFNETNGFNQEYRVVSDYEWMLKVFLRNPKKYLYIDRYISIVDSHGESGSSRWENERIRVMARYFLPHEILFYRVVPRYMGWFEKKMKNLSETLR